MNRGSYTFKGKALLMVQAFWWPLFIIPMETV